MAHRPRRALLVAGLLLTLLPAVAAPATAQPAPPVGGALLGTPGVVADPDAGVAPPPQVEADAYVLADLETGEVLAAKSAHQRFAPASTLKMLTALALLPRLEPEQTHVGTRADTEVEGSRVGIYPGGRYTVDQLFEALFLMSGNDAANALADVAGGVDVTVGLMNEEARRLQAFDTIAVNPSGLDAPGQLSSAYDLALIARDGLAREDFRRYAGTVRSTFPGRPGETFEIWNQNRLLRDYDGAFGVKTGYTTQAGSTFVGAAGRGDRELVVSLLHGEHGAWREAEALLDWGFAHAENVQPVGHLVDPVPQSGATPPTEPESAPPARTGSTGGSLLPEASGSVAVWALAALGALSVLALGLRRRHAAAGPGTGPAGGEGEG